MINFTERAPRLTEEQLAFLEAYRELGTIAAAARAVDISPEVHHLWLGDPDYDIAFDDAKEDAADLFAARARRRAVQGWEEPLVRRGKPADQLDSRGQKTEKAVTIRWFDNSLLITLLKGAEPEVYRENFTGEVPKRPPPCVDLSRLTDQELDQLELLAAKITVVGD
jgi:hypothetical protein